VSSVKEALSQAYNAGMENKTTVGKHEVKYTDWSDECEAICHLVCVEGDEEGEEMYYERVCNDCGTVNYIATLHVYTHTHAYTHTRIITLRTRS